MDETLFNDDESLQNKHYSLKDIKILKSFMHYLKPYMVSFSLILVLDIFVNAMFTVEPVLYSEIINILSDITSAAPKISVDEAKESIILFVSLDLAFLIAAAFLAFVVSYGLRKTGEKVIKDFRDDVYKHVLSLSQKQLKSMKIGSFVTRITNDTQNLSTFFSNVLPQMLRALLSLFIIIGFTFYKVKLYGFIFLAFIPVVFAISFFFRRQARKYYRNEKNSVSRMNSFLSESFSGIRVTKTYNREDKKLDEFEQKNNDIFKYFLKSQDLFALFYPSMYMLQMLCVIIVISFSVPAVINEVMEVGAFTLLFTYSSQFFQPIQTITSLLNTLQSIFTSAERTQYINNMEPEIVNGDKMIDVDSFKGKVEFRNVYFKYEDAQEYVLKDVSFIINPGETVAFVGATGAGKSTIISLISRTYEIDSGQILIDDVDIQDYSLECLRRNIGIMLQDVFLFSGNIKDNISLGDKEISDETIIEACKEVGADSFIDKLPNKYDEKVTERGENFSAGQRQLISFARTLVYAPSLVLLDEATANIDTETENIIQTSLERIKKIATMIIVAHRLSTIRNANHIFVVSSGKIIEDGTHQQLLKLKGTYYNLYRLQNMEREIDNREEKSDGYQD